MLRTAFRTVFPVHCLGCGQRSLTPLCNRCTVFPTWPHVEVPGLDWVVAPFDYEGAIKALIHDLKFKHFFPSGKRIQAMLRPHLLTPKPIDLVIPVPGDWRREADRGFRTPEWIWADLLPFPMASVVQRVKSTQALYGLSRSDRLRTLTNAFAVSAGLLKENGCVMLVDDIVTTGATASAVASVLRSVGVREVGLLVVAATPPT